MKKTARGIILPLLLMVMLALVFNIRQAESRKTIYINADGSIYPSGVPISSLDNVTYSITGTVTDSIVIERSNIVVDGAGHVVEGGGSGNGFSLYGTSNVTIKNTKIRGFTYGVYLEFASDNIISGNHIAVNDYDGIAVHDSSYNTITSNNITGNNWFGLRLHYSSSNSIVGNNIEANKDDGILLAWSSNNNIVGNNMVSNKHGISLLDSSNNSIYHNNLSTNTKQVHSENSRNLWDNNYPSGGNYWSDLNPPDEDKDEIGDLPYVIDENNLDEYPLIYPYGFVPKPDVNRDGTVNIIDIATVATAFGCKPGDERWNPMTDIDMNELVNIIDIADVARNFG